ncbi:MAG: hypothetical protein M5R42_02840 [Rhodocyclaceae bacterium]|nr:hypothetical protein [Rhodocyclaceae bacterium]
MVFLPDTFWIYNDRESIAETAPPRSACGLPEQGFVFCSFNASYKIEPDVFDVWMRLLARVSGSVLWLLDGGEMVRRNLRREAETRGIAPERLVSRRACRTRSTWRAMPAPTCFSTRIIAAPIPRRQTRSGPVCRC